jgi:small subunit ribosomal protein S8
MAMSDPLGDMLTRIRNGQRVGKSKVTAPASRLRLNVLDVLKREGYIRDYRRQELPTYYNGLGITILSTPRGVMSDQEARAANVGGEVLCRVF